MFKRIVSTFALVIICVFAAPSCQSPELRQRNEAIAMEPPGDYFIGRRYFVDRTQFWGYLREPGQSWDRARLVVMNEKRKRVPDRLPEVPEGGGPARGFDNNYEYRIEGYYSGEPAYCPNTNLILPEFVLTDYRLLNHSPGWLFRPNERHSSQSLTLQPPGGIPQM